MKYVIITALALLTLSFESVPAPVGQPFVNPANGHTYYLLPPSGWHAAEAQAVALGGHLVTINDAAENAWITQTFANPYGDVWIGYYRSDAQWFWISREPSTFTNWRAGEPNSEPGDLQFALLYSSRTFDRPPPGSWNDAPDDGTYIMYAVAEIAGPDLRATLLTWDSENGGIKFSLSISGGDLSELPVIAFYWANGPTLSDGTGAAAALLFSDTAEGDYGPINIPAADLSDPPLGTSHLLLVLDPPTSGSPVGDIQESDESNNILPLIDVQLSFKDNADRPFVTQHTESALRKLLRYAGSASALVTSTYRTPRQQAIVMFGNLIKGKSADYGPRGGAVIRLARRLLHERERGKAAYTDEEIIDAMAVLVEDILIADERAGRSATFKHCGDWAQVGVVDIWPPSLSNSALFKQVTRDAEAAGTVSRFGCPSGCKFYDPVFHIEIAN